MAGGQTSRRCSGSDSGPPCCGCDSKQGSLFKGGACLGRTWHQVNRCRVETGGNQSFRCALCYCELLVERGIWLRVVAGNPCPLRAEATGGGGRCSPGEGRTNWETEYEMDAASPCKLPHEYWDPRNAHFDSIEGEMSECSSQ